MSHDTCQFALLSFFLIHNNKKHFDTNTSSNASQNKLLVQGKSEKLNEFNSRVTTLFSLPFPTTPPLKMCIYKTVIINYACRHFDVKDPELIICEEARQRFENGIDALECVPSLHNETNFANNIMCPACANKKKQDPTIGPAYMVFFHDDDDEAKA